MRFESVPNFSEGRDAAAVESIAAEARGVPGVTVLDVESNADHNRSVISLVGEGDALIEALVRMSRRAQAVIDLNHHVGEHPRMGAVDVIPFVPLGEATTADAVALAVRLGERLWKELKLPVYLYADAARRPERSDLAVVRKGGFEGIRDSIRTDPGRAPDFGDAQVHPTAGIVAVGARPVLIAFNAYLSTDDVAIAKKIAHAVRARDGGLPAVKALGFDIRERGQSQVSMNLTDYRTTPIHRAMEAVRRAAEGHGVAVVEGEIVGLVPEDALFDAAEFYLALTHFERGQILERKVRAASPGATDRSLAQATVAGFAARLAARTPTPGGGSASAAAGAFGVALGEMVIAYSSKPESPDAQFGAAARRLAELRELLLTGIDEDADSFEAVRSTRRRRKEVPEDPEARHAAEQALRHAAEVPLATAQRAREAAEILRSIQGRVKPTIASDLATALALLSAASEGALANVATNVADLAAQGVEHGDLQRAAAALTSRAPP
jgi:glutamate formiminotransferase/formiminotetrahydrofolate cyclodeaminase